MLAAHYPYSFRAQRGAALLLAMFIIGLAVTAYVIKAFYAESAKSDRADQTLRTLVDAKMALIGWAVAHPELPGMMPYPDRNTDGNYDGRSDCPPGDNAFSYTHLIGQLPLYGQANHCATPQLGLGGDWMDADGNKLWYAVSRNLVREYSSPGMVPVINPGLLVSANTNYPYDGSALSSPYPWLKVVDQYGRLISDRVAVVIIAPGPALAEQNRLGGIAPASAYLDQMVVGESVIANHDYTRPDEEFVMVESPDAGVNDTLVFITVDELIVALEKRVVGEVRKAINFPVLYQNDGILSMPWLVPEKVEPIWPDDFSYEVGQVDRGYIPFRCINNSSCNTYRTAISWNMSAASGGSSGTPTPEIVDSFKEYSFAVADCLANEVYSPLLDCTGIETQDLPETVAKRIVNFSLNANMNASVSANDAILTSFVTQSFNINNAKSNNQASPNQVVVRLEDVKKDAAQQSSTMTLRSQANTSLHAEHVRAYPIMPEWYFTNRWYEYLYAVIAPAFRAGGAGVCAPETCLRLHYVQYGTELSKDNLPALIFTRRSPSTYQKDLGAASEEALDFLQPASPNTGMVTW